MSSFTPRLLLASTLIALPASALVAAPGAALAAAPASTSVTAAKKRTVKTVVRKELRSKKSGASVKRYQSYLRSHAKSVGVKYRSINPSGATGYYGTETRNLTAAMTKYFASKDSSWIPRSKSNARVHPNKKFLKLISLKGISAPKDVNAAWPAIIKATTATKPSTWKGPALKHPRTGKAFPSNVLRWANLVRAVMQEHKVADKYLVGILAQIQQESGGNPNVVNNWDSNAKRGTPSKGLLQVILPTYNYYAKKGYTGAKYQTVPYTNIWAALNYVKGRYGMSKFANWNAGYNQGY